MSDLIRFKTEAIEKLLEEHKPQLTPHTYKYIQKIMVQDAEGIGPNTLSHLCGDLECLPTDIIEYI